MGREDGWRMQQQQRHRSRVTVGEREGLAHGEREDNGKSWSYVREKRDAVAVVLSLCSSGACAREPLMTFEDRE